MSGGHRGCVPTAARELASEHHVVRGTDEQGRGFTPQLESSACLGLAPRFLCPTTRPQLRQGGAPAAAAADSKRSARWWLKYPPTLRGFETISPVSVPRLRVTRTPSRGYGSCPCPRGRPAPAPGERSQKRSSRLSAGRPRLTRGDRPSCGASDRPPPTAPERARAT